MIPIILGRAAQFILLLLVMRVATTYLSPSEMGRMSLITAASAFFSLLMVNPVGMFINRRLHAWDVQGSVRHYFKLHWAYLFVVSILAAACLAVLNNIHAFGFRFDTAWLLLLVCGSVFFNTINQTAIPSLNMLELRWHFVILTLATISSGLATSYLLVRTFQQTAEFWLLGLLLGQAIFGVIGVKKLFEKLQPEVPAARLTRAHVLRLFVFAWPVALSVGFNWLQTQGYRFIVVNVLGLETLGLFVTGYGISAGLIAALESVLTTYFQPKFYKRVSGDNAVEQSMAWNRYAGAILPSLILSAFLVVGLASELTRIFVGPEYQSASQYVIWGVLAESARVVAGVYTMSAHAKMKTRLLLMPNIFGAGICIALIWELVPGLGAHGVGLARALAGVVVVVVMHVLMIKELEMELPYRMLLKGLGLGGLMLLISAIMHEAMGEARNLVSAAGIVVLAGLIFLPMFLWLLYPFLPRHDNQL